MQDAPPALQALDISLDALPPPPSRHTVSVSNWRWTVRQRLSPVRELVANGAGYAGERWLATLDDVLLKERTLLLERVSAAERVVLSGTTPDELRRDLKRLAIDIDHHLRRLREQARALES